MMAKVVSVFVLQLEQTTYVFALVEGLKALRKCLSHIIHPSAITSKLASLGYGVCAMPGVIVNSSNRIGGDPVIGAGSIVIKNVPDDVTSAGIPSQIIR